METKNSLEIQESEKEAQYREQRKNPKNWRIYSSDIPCTNCRGGGPNYRGPKIALRTCFAMPPTPRVRQHLCPTCFSRLIRDPWNQAHPEDANAVIPEEPPAKPPLDTEGRVYAELKKHGAVQ